MVSSPAELTPSPVSNSDEAVGDPSRLKKIQLAQLQHLRWIGYPLTREMVVAERVLEECLEVSHTEPEQKADIPLSHGKITQKPNNSRFYLRDKRIGVM